jgi:hypothetical protein
MLGRTFKELSCVVIFVGMSIYFYQATRVEDGENPIGWRFDFDPRLRPSRRAHDIMRANGYRLYRTEEQPTITVMYDVPTCHSSCELHENPVPIDSDVPYCDPEHKLEPMAWCRPPVDPPCYHTVCDYIEEKDESCRCVKAIRCRQYCERNATIQIDEWKLLFNDSFTGDVPERVMVSGTLSLVQYTEFHNVDSQWDNMKRYSSIDGIHTQLKHRLDELVWVKQNETRVDIGRNQHQGTLFLGADTRRWRPISDFVFYENRLVIGSDFRL